MFVVVSYDIVDDKRRNKLAKLLENYGYRVQYSVFECIVEEEKLKEMKENVSKVIDKNEDSVRFYKICEGCLKKIDIIGIGEVVSDKEFYVI